MNCKIFGQHVVNLADGDLAVSKRDELLLHIETCSQCQSVLESELQSGLAGLARRPGSSHETRPVDGSDNHRSSKSRDEFVRDVIRRMESEQRSTQGTHFGVIRLMRHRFVQVAAAAAVIVLSVNSLLDFGRGFDPSAALAAAMDRMRQAETVVCRFRYYLEGGPNPLATDFTLYAAKDRGALCVSRAFGVEVSRNYYFPDGNALMVTFPMMPIYFRLSATPATQNGKNELRADIILNKFLDLADDVDAVTIEQGFTARDGRHLFEVPCEVFGLPFEGSVFVEIDSTTNLPLRLEVRQAPNQSGRALRWIYDSFGWDESFDVDMLTPEIPSDAAIVDMELPAMNDETLIDGLRQFAEYSGDSYPSSLDHNTIILETFAATGRYVLEHGMPLDTDSPAFAKWAQRPVKIAHLAAVFHELLFSGRRIEYFGDKVKPGAKDEVLARWLGQDDEWRVLYGDLRLARE